MSTYFVAGKANDPFLAVCQHVADKLAKNLSTFSVEYDVKHPDDWDAFLAQLCANKGFTHIASPVCWNSEGRLVGGWEDFLSHLGSKYRADVSFTMTDMLAVSNEHFARVEKAKRESAIETYAAARKAKLNTLNNAIRNEKGLVKKATDTAELLSDQSEFVEDFTFLLPTKDALAADDYAAPTHQTYKTELQSKFNCMAFPPADADVLAGTYRELLEQVSAKMETTWDSAEVIVLGLKLAEAFSEEVAFVDKVLSESTARLAKLEAEAATVRDHADEAYPQSLRDDAQMYESAAKIQAVERGRNTRKEKEVAKKDKEIVALAAEFLELQSS